VKHAAVGTWTVPSQERLILSDATVTTERAHDFFFATL
jgi:hypothetical protein